MAVMRRALSSWRVFPLALILLAIAGSTAVAKPRVAVLGLEVTGTIDQASTTVARELTEGLRSRARGGNGPYQLAPNSDRELIDEKLIKSCDSEAAGCMAAIGRDLGADVLIYGKVEKVRGGYRAILHVLDVSSKSQDKELTLAVSSGMSGDAVRAAARKAYVDLVGGAAPVGGTLIVTSNVPAGRVLIDDEPKDELVAGTATIVLPEGRYRLAIEAEGYRRKQRAVLLTSGVTITETLDLALVAKGGDDDGDGLGVWKPLFGVSLALTVGLAAYSTYNYLEMGSEMGQFTGTRVSMRPGDITEGDCANRADVRETSTGNHFEKACDLQTQHKVTAYAALIAGAAVLGTGYMAFFRGSSTEAPTTSARRAGGRRALAITPVVNRDGAGATLRLAW